MTTNTAPTASAAEMRAEWVAGLTDEALHEFRRNEHARPIELGRAVRAELARRTGSATSVVVFAVGDRVAAARCVRADNVHYERHGIVGTVEQLMGASIVFRDDAGALYFAGRTRGEVRRTL